MRLASLALLACLVLSCCAGRDRDSIVARDGLEYIWIPPGEYRMGCAPTDAECEPRERPRHPVEIKAGFWFGRTEVTVAAYRRFAEATGGLMPAPPDFNRGWLLDDHPMVKVSWYDATAYCAWLGGRLPTEAEWEYAARAGRESKYPWGDAIGRDRANYGRDECCGGMADGPDRWTSTSPVGSFPPNDFGLYDVAGNVWEWCEDVYRADAHSAPRSGATGAEDSSPSRTLRGGCWSCDPWLLRLSYRLGSDPANESNYSGGFRCALDRRP